MRGCFPVGSGGAALAIVDAASAIAIGQSLIRRPSRTTRSWATIGAKSVLYNLHLLRVIAALGVVYFHTTSTAGLKLDWDVGSRGVDVFFVISGFIISYIGIGRPKFFFRRR